MISKHRHFRQSADSHSRGRCPFALRRAAILASMVIISLPGH